MKVNVSELKRVFAPNQTLSKTVLIGMVSVQIVLALAWWMSGTSEIIPKPGEIWGAFKKMVFEEKILPELWSSAMLSVKSMTIAVIVSLLFSYLTVMPFFRPIAFVLSKGRFLGLAGLTFIFTLMTANGHDLKVTLLVFGISVFFITSMTSVIQNIPKSDYNYARTLRMNEWETVWHVVVLWRLDQVFEIIRNTFAISWTMLTMVEGLVRSEGGIGSVLLSQNKHFHIDAVFAIQLTILIFGILQDYIIGVLKNFFCPHAKITLERK
jgi:NitT/TauT family transport system permease protein